MFQEIGMPADFVNEMAEMFHCMEIGEDLCKDFKDWCQNNIAEIAGKHHS